MKKTFSLLLCLLLFLSVLAECGEAVASPQNDTTQLQEVLTARPSVSGRLHVEGTKLADEAGQTVVLRGVCI